MAKLARMLADEDAHGHAGADVRRTPRLRTRYYAFLSYSHQDKDLADWLHRELEKFRVPHSLAGQPDGDRGGSAPAYANLPRPA